MTTLTIEPVINKAGQKAFLKFAHDLYRDDPNWVPPLVTNIRELLNFKKHPFYDNAEIQTFLARRDGKVVGRIAAIVDGWHNDYHKERRGMFGFFECIDDVAVSDALFDAARDWFAEREIVSLRGPANPSQNYEWGMLVEGFDVPPTFLITYNKPYYGALVEHWGFKKAEDLFSYSGHISRLDTLDPKLAFISEEARKRFNVNVRPIDEKNFDRDVRTFLEIYNKALPGQWGFTPLSEGELIASAHGLKMLIVPEMTTVAEVDGKPVGVVFGLLDYNPIIKKINGKLFPFGFLRILFGKKKLTTLRLVSTNVLPEYQRWGLGLVLMTRLVPFAVKWGVTQAEFSWVLESNRLSRGTLERSNVPVRCTHRIYDYEPS